MKKRIASLLLLVLLLATIPSVAEEDQLIEMSILLREDASAVSRDMLYFQLVEEELGIDLEPVAINVSNYEEKLNLLLATRDLPDLVSISHNAQSLLAQYGAEGAFIPLNEYWDRLPNVVKWIDEYEEDEFVWEKITSPDGNVYGAPVFNLASGCGNYFSVREDIMEEHNLAYPTTWEELTELLRTFKELYPDFPGLTKPDSTIYERTAPMFGTRNGVYFDYEVNAYVDGRKSEGFKDMLLWYQNLYNEGLLDPDSFSMTRDMFESGILNGKYLIYIGYTTWGDNLSAIAQQTDPDFRFMYFTHPEYNGEVQKIIGAPCADPNIVWCIPTTCRNMDAALTMLDWLYSDAGIMATCYGKEGVTYYYEEDGTARFMPEYSTARNLEGTLNYNDEGIRCHQWYGVLPFQIDFYGPSNEASFVYTSEHDLFERSDPPFHWVDEMDEEDYNVIMGQVNTILDEAMTQFVVGNQPLSYWEDALATAEAVGWQDALDLRMESHEAMLG